MQEYDIFCSYCDSRLFFEDRTCPSCGAPTKTSIYDEYIYKEEICKTPNVIGYMGISLEENNVNEPSHSSGYERIPILENSFETFSSKYEYKNVHTFIFPESVEAWGKIKSLLFFNRNGIIKLISPLDNFRYFSSGCTLMFCIGSISINIDPNNILN